METTDANPLESMLKSINEGVEWFGSMTPVFGVWANIALFGMIVLCIMMVAHAQWKRRPRPIMGVMRHRRARR
ncbi:hypothetical protein D3C85_84060 [compost metagenome]|jgi:hypothetical protein